MKKKFKQLNDVDGDVGRNPWHFQFPYTKMDLHWDCRKFNFKRWRRRRRLCVGGWTRMNSSLERRRGRRRRLQDKSGDYWYIFRSMFGQGCYVIYVNVSSMQQSVSRARNSCSRAIRCQLLYCQPSVFVQSTWGLRLRHWERAGGSEMQP